MGLFICRKCGHVEDDRYCDEGVVTTEDGKKIDSNYPNLLLEEMKKSENCRMLCSECNTGEWHGHFEKRKPEPIEALVALFSRCKYITPEDHIVKLVEDKNVTAGYNIEPVLYKMIKQAKGKVGQHPLYVTYVKHKDSFNPKAVDMLDDIEDLFNPTEEDEKKIREAKLTALGSYIEKLAEESKSK